MQGRVSLLEVKANNVDEMLPLKIRLIFYSVHFTIHNLGNYFMGTVVHQSVCSISFRTCPTSRQAVLLTKLVDEKMSG